VTCWAAGAILLGTAFLPAAAAAAAPAPGSDRAVEAGRGALAGRLRLPWYDAERDDLRRIDVSPPKELAKHRNSGWEVRPRKQPNWDLSRFWSVFWTLVKWAFWGITLAIFVFLVWLLARMFINREVENAAGDGLEATADPTRTEADLIEQLPYQVKRPQTDLLGEARRHYEAGDYGEAIIYLFSYQLVQLDLHHWIGLARGKTNRQYLRELAARADLRQLLAQTMVAFEDVFFGHHPLERPRFERCWNRLDEFHAGIQEETSA
jgi:hypothetical protein